MVRHFWERNGIKSAIDAVVKLPDYSVGILSQHIFGCIVFGFEYFPIIPTALFRFTCAIHDLCRKMPFAGSG